MRGVSSSGRASGISASKQEGCNLNRISLLVGSVLFVPQHRSGYFLISIIKVKVKFTLEQAMNAQRGSRGIALLLL
jgi:hypothetical protein